MKIESRPKLAATWPNRLVALAALLATGALSGCLIAGVSSNGGAFIWPGGIGLVVLILLVVFLLRRR